MEKSRKRTALALGGAALLAAGIAFYPNEESNVQITETAAKVKDATKAEPSSTKTAAKTETPASSRTTEANNEKDLLQEIEDAKEDFESFDDAIKSLGEAADKVAEFESGFKYGDEGVQCDGPWPGDIVKTSRGEESAGHSLHFGLNEDEHYVVENKFEYWTDEGVTIGTMKANFSLPCTREDGTNGLSVTASLIEMEGKEISNHQDGTFCAPYPESDHADYPEEFPFDTQHLLENIMNPAGMEDLVDEGEALCVSPEDRAEGARMDLEMGPQ